ncbi:hypothetical protein ACQEV4_23360 [Streptomyces shenzhenensis]|uniref:hypothetical protein n=1 Tax=Streptomyces shenzhenensis TaxID=943815 RepID=UPI003D9410BE
MTSKEQIIPARNRPLIFNAFEMTGVGYYAHGTWTHPRSHREGFTDLSFWLDRARQFEEGLFDAVFFADVLGSTTSTGGPRIPRSAAPSTSRCWTR